MGNGDGDSRHIFDRNVHNDNRVVVVAVAAAIDGYRTGHDSLGNLLAHRLVRSRLAVAATVGSLRRTVAVLQNADDSCHWKAPPLRDDRRSI